jgi:hypothetical protein
MLGAFTMMGADPLWPSLVAVMFARPAPTAVTNPIEFTVAIEGRSDDQTTARPVRAVPFASLTLDVA